MDAPFLPYDPGQLPTKPPPDPGDSITIELPGLPPHKEIRQSIRNVTHPRYEAFVALRRAATDAMDGRAWYLGPVQLDLTVYARSRPDNVLLIDYVSGVMDTLDGSHGPSFTYLPIVYEDDCQVASGTHQFVESNEEKYEIRIVFLRDTG